jgi:ADP-ribose pyrophosphatase YjhB (NUDIX family)
MLAINIVARAVVVSEGRLLTTVMNDGLREPFHCLMGGHQKAGESLLDCLPRVVADECGLRVAPLRLLYVVENFFARGARRMHETGFYFLCAPAQALGGDLLDALTANRRKMISPELLSPDELGQARFQPTLLRDCLVEGLRGGFTGGPKLVIVNELPDVSGAQSGVFEL